MPIFSRLAVTKKARLLFQAVMKAVPRRRLENSSNFSNIFVKFCFSNVKEPLLLMADLFSFSRLLHESTFIFIFKTKYQLKVRKESPLTRDLLFVISFRPKRISPRFLILASFNEQSIALKAIKVAKTNDIYCCKF